jgi:hypothetical protein
MLRTAKGQQKPVAISAETEARRLRTPEAGQSASILSPVTQPLLKAENISFLQMLAIID